MTPGDIFAEDRCKLNPNLRQHFDLIKVSYECGYMDRGSEMIEELIKNAS